MISKSRENMIFLTGEEMFLSEDNQSFVATQWMGRKWKFQARLRHPPAEEPWEAQEHRNCDSRCRLTALGCEIGQAEVSDSCMWVIERDAWQLFRPYESAVATGKQKLKWKFLEEAECSIVSAEMATSLSSASRFCLSIFPYFQNMRIFCISIFVIPNPHVLVGWWRRPNVLEEGENNRAWACAWSNEWRQGYTWMTSKKTLRWSVEQIRHCWVTSTLDVLEIQNISGGRKTPGQKRLNVTLFLDGIDPGNSTHSFLLKVSHRMFWSSVWIHVSSSAKYFISSSVWHKTLLVLLPALLFKWHFSSQFRIHPTMTILSDNSLAKFLAGSLSQNIFCGKISCQEWQEFCGWATGHCREI